MGTFVCEISRWSRSISVRSCFHCDLSCIVQERILRGCAQVVEKSRDGQFVSGGVRDRARAYAFDLLP